MATDFAYLMVKVGASIGDLQTGLASARGAVSSFGATGKSTMDNWVAQNGAMVKATGRNMLLMGGAITAVAGLAIKSFAEMEASMANVSTMLDEQTMHLLPEYEAGMRSLAEESGDSLTSLTKGMYDLLSAMIEPTEAMDVLNIASKTAVAGMTSTAVAVDGMTTILNSYGLEAKEAGSVSDWFFTIVKRGKTTFDELAPAIGAVAPIASSAGISLEEMGGMLALLTRNGVKTDIAITSLKAVITAFGSAGGEAKEIAKELGFEMSASALKENGLAWAMQQVNKASDDQMAVLVGNVRAKLATSVATQNLTQYEEDLMAMQNRSGVMMVAYTKNNETLQKEMERLGATFKNVKDEAIAKIIPEFSDMVIKTKEALQTFREWSRNNEELSTTLVKVVVGTGPVLIALGTFLTLLPGIVTGIGLVMTGLTGFVTFMTGPWGVVMATAVIAIKKVADAWIDASIAEAKASNQRKELANQSVDSFDIMNSSLEDLKSKYSDLTDEEERAISSTQHFNKYRQDVITTLKEDGEVTKADEKAIFDWTTQQNLASQEIIRNINAREHKTDTVRESTTAVENEEVALKKVIEAMDEEKEKVNLLKEKYKELNVQLQQGKISKEEYSEKMRGLIDTFSSIEGGASKVLDIMAKIDESDPNVAVKFEIFGMEQYEDTQLRIRKINQDIVLEKLTGDERQIQSTKFELENFLFVIDRKIEAEKMKNEEILRDLKTSLETQMALQLARLKDSKEITQEEYNDAVSKAKAKYETDKKIIEDTQQKNFDAYNQEKQAFTEKTEVILSKLEEKRRKSREVGEDAVKMIDKEGKSVEALGDEYNDLNKEAGVKRGREMGTVTKASMKDWGATLNQLIKQDFGSSTTQKASTSRTVRAPRVMGKTLGSKGSGYDDYNAKVRAQQGLAPAGNQGNFVGGDMLGPVYGPLTKLQSEAVDAVAQVKARQPTVIKETLRSGFARGTDFVQATGDYTLHKGEKVVPAGQNRRNQDAGGDGVTIINLFKEEMIPEIMAKYPGAIINTISSDIANHGVTKKVIMGALRNA